MQPIRLQLDLVQPVDATTAFALRVFPEDAAYTELRQLRHGVWTRCLAFRPIPRDAAYVVAQDEAGAARELAAHGTTLLRDHVIVARQRPDGVDTLIDRKLKRRFFHADGSVVTTTTVLATPADFRQALLDVFDLATPVLPVSLSLQRVLGIDARL